MKFIKKLEENRNLSIAQTKTYKSVIFSNGFAKFLDALVIEGLVADSDKRQVVDGLHQWADQVAKGGVSLKTTAHPLVSSKNFAGDVTVTGSPDNLQFFERLLEMHDVTYEG